MSAISRLSVDHVEEPGAAVRIHLGALPVELPPPVAEVALQQVEVRRGHAVVVRTATELPAAVLARTLGIDLTAAVK